MGLLERFAGELAYHLGPRMAPPVEPLERVSRWNLYVSPVLTITGAAAALEVLQGANINLLSFDRPTLMQEWRLRSISLPVGVKIKQAGGEHPNAVVTVTATLRVAGDEAWSSAGETGRGGTIHNLTLSGVFADPILVRTGQTLTLDLAASCYEACEALEVLAGGRFSGTGKVEQTGVLRYDDVHYSGRRSV